MGMWARERAARTVRPERRKVAGAQWARDFVAVVTFTGYTPISCGANPPG
jgi:hypothetical protein